MTCCSIALTKGGWDGTAEGLAEVALRTCDEIEAVEPRPEAETG